MIPLLLALAAGFILVERLFPANHLPSSKGWWKRVLFVNLLQLGVVILAGQTWDRWLARSSIFSLEEVLPTWAAALLCYFVSTFIYYWWHRVRHESSFFWRLCHQLHHSPRRIEILASFYKHPLEITINSLISSTLVYFIFGLSLHAAVIYTVIIAVAEYFYHWNIRTPHWLGPLFQRPESHRIHHQYQHHSQNYADLPIWDLLFKTYHNPLESPPRCGFSRKREEQLVKMLTFQDVHGDLSPSSPPPAPGSFPTCFGCRKRSLCQVQSDRSIRSCPSIQQ